MSEVLDAASAATYLGVTYPVIQRQIKLGKIAYQQQGRKFMFHKSNLDQWLKKNRRGIAKVLTIANQKGGVGKTTTALAFASILSGEGKRVLLVDFDPQSTVTKSLLLRESVEINKPTGDSPWGASLLMTNPEDHQLHQSQVFTTPHKGFSQVKVLPSSLSLFKAPTMARNIAKESVLREALQPFRSEFDYIIIDCGPTYGDLLTNAVVAADMVVTPIELEEFAVDGLSDLVATVQSVRKYLGEEIGLRIFVNKRAKRGVQDALASELQIYQQYVSKIEVPANTGVPTSQAEHGELSGKARDAYEALVKDVLGLLGE